MFGTDALLKNLLSLFFFRKYGILITMKKIEKSLFVTVSGWAVFLFVLAVVPRGIVTNCLPKDNYASLAHVAAYVVLGFLVYFNFFIRKSNKSLRIHEWAMMTYTVGIAAACGIFTEGLQFLTLDRTPDWADFWADMLGTFMAIGLFMVISKFILLFQLLTRRTVSLPSKPRVTLPL